MSDRKTDTTDTTEPTNDPKQPRVPCPYGDKEPVDLAYYLEHTADFYEHAGNARGAELFKAAAACVRGKSASMTRCGES